MKVKKPPMVEGWRVRIWRYWSVQLNAAASAVLAMFIAWPGALNDIYGALPAELKAVLPLRVGMFIPLGLMLASIAVRPILQRKLNGDD